MIDTFTFLTFRRLGTFCFAFLRDLPVLFAGCVAIRLQFVIPCHLALNVALAPLALLVSACCKKNSAELTIHERKGQRML